MRNISAKAHGDFGVVTLMGQQQVFPAFLRGSIFLTVPAPLPLPLLIYRFLRVRFGKAYKNQLPPNAVPATT